MFLKTLLVFKIAFTSGMGPSPDPHCACASFPWRLASSQNTSGNVDVIQIINTHLIEFWGVYHLKKDDNADLCLLN